LWRYGKGLAKSSAGGGEVAEVQEMLQVLAEASAKRRSQAFGSPAGEL